MNVRSPSPMSNFQKTVPPKKETRGAKTLKVLRMSTLWFALILLVVKSFQVQLLGKQIIHDAINLNMQRSTSKNDSLSTVDASQAITLNQTVTQHDQRTLLLLMLFHNDDYQQSRVRELHQTFGTNFYVVWGGRLFDVGSNSTVATSCPYTSPIQCIDHTQVVISASHQFSHMCCLQEMAVTWALQHRHTFGRVWFMEDDVHYTQVSVLQNLMTSYDDWDLVHQAPTEQLWTENQWGHIREARQQAGDVFGSTPLYRGLFNVFRLSRRFLDALDLTYHMLDQDWVFFEALLPTVAKHYRLTSGLWEQPRVNSPTNTVATNVSSNAINKTALLKKMRFRPCFTNFPEPGIYHPAKYGNGEFQEC